MKSVEEQKRLLNEQLELQKLQNEAKQQTATQQQSEAMGEEGGDGMVGPGGQIGSTPGDLQDQADQLAARCLQDPTHSRQLLSQIKATNETLWALVKGKLQDQRQQLTSQGRDMAMAQLQQGGM